MCITTKTKPQKNKKKKKPFTLPGKQRHVFSWLFCCLLRFIHFSRCRLAVQYRVWSSVCQLKSSDEKKKSVTKEEIKKIDHNKSWNQHFRRVRSSKSHRRHVRRWNGKAFWPPVSLPLNDVDRDYGLWIRMKSKATGSVLPLGADWSIRWKVIGGCVLKRATGAEQLLAGRFYILIWDPAQLCGDAGSHGEPDSSWFQDKRQGRLEKSEETKRHFGRNIHQIDTTKVTSPFILGKKRRTAKKSH